MWILPPCIVVPLWMGGGGFIVLILTCVVGGCLQDPKGDLTEDAYSIPSRGTDGLGDAGGSQVG